jgi:diguanylate cyclase (GGDEF)-like protein
MESAMGVEKELLMSGETDSATSMINTVLSTIPGMAVIAVISANADPVLGLNLEPRLEDEESRTALTEITERVQAQLIGSPTKDSVAIEGFSFMVGDVAWSSIIEPIVRESTVIAGVLVLARPTGNWTERERSLGKAFGELLSLLTTQKAHSLVLARQTKLDALVSQVAEHLMAAPTSERAEALQWTVTVLGEFLGADVVFMRRHDHERNLSIMEAEWPSRNWNPEDGPDPLWEVAFDSDPLFAKTQHLRSTYFPELESKSDEYLERVKTGGNLADDVGLSGIAVPLLMQDVTWGLLGFLHFRNYSWVISELNALQAVASMVIQFQGRVDAEYNANHDPLTGLPNRRAIVNEMDRRMADEEPLAVMIIDLDRFKIMNDFLGHGAGDTLLCAMAERIIANIRPDDFAARLGGDEFVFLMGDTASEEEALAGAQRVLEIIAQPTTIAGRALSHTASIGVALSEPGVAGIDLLGFADIALYAAKDRGRARAEVFDEELRVATRERSLTELMLGAAVERGDLRLHFQPEIDLESGEILALEALVRWEHPTKGLLAAGDFIGIAEETGLIVDIDTLVLAEACRQLSSWMAQYPNLDLVMRVNMSPADFRSEGFMEMVESCLRENNVPARNLCIEVTEHVLSEAVKIGPVLEELRSLGIEVAIDDFGTGFASMTELKNLPVDFLKLDMSFVSGVTTDRYDQAIVESIIRLAQALDLDIIAEGIEDAETARALIELGCRRGQGYLFARPASAVDLGVVLEAGSVPISSLIPAV